MPAEIEMFKGSETINTKDGSTVMANLTLAVIRKYADLLPLPEVKKAPKPNLSYLWVKTSERMPPSDWQGHFAVGMTTVFGYYSEDDREWRGRTDPDYNSLRDYEPREVSHWFDFTVPYPPTEDD